MSFFPYKTTDDLCEKSVSASSGKFSKRLKAANDNWPRVTDNLPEHMQIVEGELDILETYLRDIITKLVAANDN